MRLGTSKFLAMATLLVLLQSCLPWNADGDYGGYCEGDSEDHPYSEAGFDFVTPVTPSYAGTTGHPIARSKSVKLISDTSNERITVEIVTESGDVYRINYKVGKSLY